MELITKRFLLREFVEDDLPVFSAYHADPRSLEFYRGEVVPGHAQDLFDAFKAWANEHPRRNYQLAIAKRDDSQLLIGCCGLRGADCEVGKAELGIELAPQYWGRYGYAVEVMRALVEFGFGSLGLKTIYGVTVSVNDRIARVASSFGAVAVTRPTPAWMVARGWSQVEWQVTREQWESGRLAMRSNRHAKASS
jgi:ribosomal-protein-alanine N-acetyltransferase